MLALDDAALACLAIAATAVPSHRRAQWLAQLADRIDPPPRKATRQARWRARQRNGASIYRIELNAEHAITALLESGRLSERDALCHEAVETALGHVLTEWSERWLHK